MRVLIAMDSSEFSGAALQSIIDRKWWGDTEFLIMSVVQTIVPVLNDFSPHYAEIARIQAADKKAATELLKISAGKLSDAHPHCPVSSFVAEGNIADQIIEKANSWDSDLIVLGSHGRKGLNKLLLGSVAESILQRAQCSVEIVKLHQAGKSGEPVGSDSNLVQKATAL
jgi:nucleotide-binding universal stress UspA family protein